MRPLFKSLSIAGVSTALAATAVMTGVAGPTSTTPEPISDVQCLRKMALDLTHRGPTPEEVAAIKNGTSSLDEMADSFLASAEFEAVVTSWYRPQFPPTDETPPAVDVLEPSRIATYIVVNDLDYRQILTGTFTIDETGAMQPVTDRPAAGVLSTAHYMSAYGGSYRRNWAGHFLREWTGIQLEAVTLPPEVNPNDLNPDDLINNPACGGCHGNEIYGIDRLAPFTFCYRADGTYDDTCDAATTSAGTFLLEPGAGLPMLAAITADSREFRAQTVNKFYTQLFGRWVAKQETKYYVRAASAFLNSDFSAKALIKHMVTSPEYCAR